MRKPRLGTVKWVVHSHLESELQCLDLNPCRGASDPSQWVILTLMLTHREGESCPPHLYPKGKVVTGDRSPEHLRKWLRAGPGQVRQARSKHEEALGLLGVWALYLQAPEREGPLTCLCIDLLCKISRYFPIFQLICFLIYKGNVPESTQIFT